MKNPISIKFGRKSKRRLGSIVLTKDKVSAITLTGLFKDEEVPEYVVLETIVHELIHYIHGFSSTLERLHKYPHQGGIIKKEMYSRGFGRVYADSKSWMRDNWQQYVYNVERNSPHKRKKKRRVTYRARRGLMLRLLAGKKVVRKHKRG